ncbi:type II secretion system protein GspL [Luteimonas sp. WGS1318]|uniref:type II secretion system protein GspL n=1 Tax=Luteimonas sp. WGS1318 TaxID=3366815 RepID=UPI00372D4CA8
MNTAFPIRLLQLGADPSRAATCLSIDTGGHVVARRHCDPAHPLPAEPGMRDILVVPAEALRLHWFDLPARSAAQAVAAARLMLQDHVAQPGTDLHVAVGDPETGDPQRLLGVVDAALMRDWLQQAAQLGLRPAAVVPDCLLLDAPTDDGVQVCERDGLLLARGRKLAVAAEPDLLQRLIGARPVQRLDDGARDARFAANALAAPALDLLQGPYARRDEAQPRRRRRLRWLAALALLSPLLLVGAQALYHGLAARSLETRADALAAQYRPQLTGAGLGTYYRQRLAPDMLATHSAALFEALRAVPGARLDSYEFTLDTGVRAGLVHGSEQDLELVRHSLADRGLALVPLDSQPVETGLRSLVAVEPL